MVSIGLQTPLQLQTQTLQAAMTTLEPFKQDSGFERRVSQMYRQKVVFVSYWAPFVGDSSASTISNMTTADFAGPKYHYPVDCHKKKQPAAGQHWVVLRFRSPAWVTYQNLDTRWLQV